MIACPKCSSQSPDGSLHCVHCGHKLGEDDPAATRMGMPVPEAVAPAGGDAPRPGGPKPVSERAGGPRTAQFGAEDLARLAAAAAEADAAAESDAAANQRASLLSGLPRPRVASKPSPLTEGLRQAPRPKRTVSAPSSARRTVMGMPVFLRDEPSSAPAAPPPPEAPATPAAPSPKSEGSGPVIQSLDSFDPDGAPEAPEVRVERREANDAPEAPGAASEAVADRPSPAPEPAPAPTTSAAEPAPSSPSAAAAPAGEPARPPEPGPLTDTEAPADGSDRSRLIGAALGLGLLIVAIRPLTGEWIWDALRSLDGAPHDRLLAVTGGGLVSVVAAALPIKPAARWPLILLAAAAAAYGLILV